MRAVTAGPGFWPCCAMISRTWLFLVPALVFFIGYQAYPIIRVVWISFTDYQYLTNEPANWVGFNNYLAAMRDPLMWASLWRAALFTLLFLPGCIILPLSSPFSSTGCRNPSGSPPSTASCC